MAKNPEKKSSKSKWIIGIALGLVLALTGGTAGYALYYQDRVLPGVKISGLYATGQAKDELISSIEQKAAQTSLELKYEGLTTQVPLTALGVQVDAESMADEAFKPNASLSSRLNTLFQPITVATKYTINEDTLNYYLNSFTALNGKPAVDATVKIADDGTSFTTTPAEAGAGIPVEKLSDAVEKAATNFENVPVELTAETLAPQVSDEAAADTAAKANALLGLDVSLVADGRVINADQATKAQWVSLVKTSAGYEDPKFDTAKLSEWISSTATSTNTPPVEGVHNVDLSGKVLSTYKEAKPGRSVNNVDALSTSAAETLNSGNPFTGTLTYERTEGTYTTRLIAEGAENLIYPAVPGEKWVNVDLTNFTVTPYEGATQVASTMLMVPGAPQMPTPTGKYKVYLKYVKQTMRGTNLDGSRYETPDVPWVTYFNGGVGFHGAPWQPFFGPGNPNGSHGCINMSVSDARFMHSWADIGTTVIVHY